MNTIGDRLHVERYTHACTHKHTHTHAHRHTHTNGVFLNLCRLLAFSKARWIRWVVDSMLTDTHMHTHTHARRHIHTNGVVLYLCRSLAFGKATVGGNDKL